MSELRRALPELGVPTARIAAAEQLLDGLVAARSFEEAYAILGAEYIVESDGSLTGLASESYSLILSLSVLEHVRLDILPKVMAETHRLLHPGGYAVHQFDLSDHYSHFDPKASRKNYLRFSPATWDRWLSSRVMYINRVQRPQWDEIFRQADFEILDCVVVKAPLGNITVHPSYELNLEDAQAVSIRYHLQRR
jgi:hypothetical protein